MTSATEGIVPETDLAITATLHEALVCLRKQDKVRTLWVDQICINQNNDIDGEREKSAQVKMMGEIYASSKRTHVWLRRGRPLPWYFLPQKSELPEFFIQIMKSFRMLMQDGELQLIPGLGWRGFHKEKSLHEMTKDYRAKYCLPDPNDERWELFHGLFDAPWFSRVWVIQEVALPRSVQVHYANLCVDWDSFVGVMSFVRSLGLICMDLKRPEVRNWYVRLRALDERRQLTQRGKLESLDQLLSRHREAEASKEEDHIFGLMGLASQDSLPLEPDYSSALRHVFLTTAEWALSRGGFDILGLCGDPSHPKNPEELRGLPSWVPDFSDRSGPPSLTGMSMLSDDRFKALREFNASKSGNDNAGVFLRVTDKRFLEARGQFIGTIEEVSAGPAPFRAKHVSHDLRTPAQFEHSIPHQFEFVSETLRFFNHKLVWDQMAERILKDKSMENVLLSTYFLGAGGQALETARQVYEGQKIDLKIWQTITLGHGCSSPFWGYVMFKTTRMVLTPVVLLRDLWHLFGHKPLIQEAEYNERRRLSAERELFRSKDGQIGLAPRWAVRGDKICILQGGKAPVILRGTGEDGPYKFIGEAYVHGVMHGEIFDLDKCEQVIID